MKVLHLQRKFTSPTETFIVNQINAISVFESYVFTIKFLNFLAVKAKVFYPSRGFPFSTLFLSSLHKRFFLNEFETIAPSIIHSHYLTDATLFHPFTKRLKVPKLISCYGYDVSVISKKLGVFVKWYYRNIFKEYDLVLAMTDEMKKDLLGLGCPESKLRVHYHGIDTKKFDVARENRKMDDVYRFLTIASLYEVKGHLTVLKALVRFMADHPLIRIKYQIVGDGPNREALLDYINMNGLNEVVILHAAVRHGPEFNKYLKEAHVFLHPSITTKQNDKEGIPGAIVEAMASGLPVISTFHGGIPSVIKNGETGFLVAERDHNAIASKLSLLYNDGKLRRTIGENAKRHAVDNFDLYAKAEELEVIYSSLLSD